MPLIEVNGELIIIFFFSFAINIFCLYLCIYIELFETIEFRLFKTKGQEFRKVGVALISDFWRLGLGVALGHIRCVANRKFKSS